MREACSRKIYLRLIEQTKQHFPCWHHRHPVPVPWPTSVPEGACRSRHKLHKVSSFLDPLLGSALRVQWWKQAGEQCARIGVHRVMSKDNTYIS
eukprot:1147744-Pelagomonas_calceolata.AAC.9